MGATHLLGRRGEELAADLLENAGLHILDRNWRCERGEIDIVARDGTTLVVVEVKTRSSRACGTPREAVTERKLKRLHVLAGVWLMRQCERFSRIRVDIVTVEPGPDGELTAEHVQGVV